MDFGALLHTAQKNGSSDKKQPVRYYSTKFEPPKKEQRSKQLSINVKKFLERKELEEKNKQKELTKKKEELLALRARDKKATRRVNVMLKRTKSANQSVIQDAIDTENTSVTLAGPAQPDEDDYGYVSQEAAAYYNKMMEKYSKMPDEPKFNLEKKRKISTNLTNTKDRVRAALEREKEEASMPHKRKRKHKEVEQNRPEEKEVETINTVNPVIKKVKSAPPPPINFADLLKIAAKKQFEPIVIEQKPKEEEKLLTKKQKKEFEREKEWRERKEMKEKAPKVETKNKIDNIKTKIVEQPIKKVVAEKKAVPIVKNEKSVKIPVQTNPNANKILMKELTKPKLINNVNNNNNNNLKLVKKGEPNKIKLNQSKDSIKPKQFPPIDLNRKDFPSKDVKRKAMITKRRILDDDEYDSEMDDFIDDGPGEGEDYSKYISEIFGYDKSRYRNLDDDVDNMESTFAQQMREEVISTKIGIMEDLEDMKKEEEEKRRKALLKKQIK